LILRSHLRFDFGFWCANCISLFMA
jgi:hypothetical protein